MIYTNTHHEQVNGEADLVELEVIVTFPGKINSFFIIYITNNVSLTPKPEISSVFKLLGTKESVRYEGSNKNLPLTLDR